MSGQVIDSNRGIGLSLSQKEKEWLSEITELAVAKISQLSHPCRFNLITDDDAKELGHFVGMVKDLGDDNLAKGIEQIRDNHNVVKTGCKISSKILWGIIAASAGVAGTYLMQAIFHIGVK